MIFIIGLLDITILTFIRPHYKLETEGGRTFTARNVVLKEFAACRS